MCFVIMWWECTDPKNVTEVEQREEGQGTGDTMSERY